jgi:hypothetical protein
MQPHLIRIDAKRPEAGRPAKVIQLEARRRARRDQVRPAPRPPRAA